MWDDGRTKDGEGIKKAMSPKESLHAQEKKSVHGDGGRKTERKET